MTAVDRLDLGALERWLARGPVTAEPIGGGASNDMYEVRAAAGGWVLRRPPGRRSDRRYIAREFRLLTALEGSEVPHPSPHRLCEDEAVLGVPFYLMERIDGFTPRDPLPAAFDGEREAMGYALVDGLAALARVDWRAAGLDGFGKPDGFLERQVPRWLGQLERYRNRDIPGLDDVAAWLAANIPAPQEPAIIHGDYQFINVMLAPEPPARLAAIVDWEQATIGDPLLDLGWVVAGWSEPGEEPLRFGSRYLTDRTGLPSRADLVSRYAARSGRSIDDLPYYVALALFKLACVLEGAYQAFVSGKSSDPLHEKMGRLVLEAVQQAQATARTGAI